MSRGAGFELRIKVDPGMGRLFTRLQPLTARQRTREGVFLARLACEMLEGAVVATDRPHVAGRANAEVTGQDHPQDPAQARSASSLSRLSSLDGFLD